MEANIYIEHKEKSLSRYFDITKDYKYKNLNVDLFCESFIRNEKYFFTKKTTLYAFETNEYKFMKTYKTLKENDLNIFLDLLKNSTQDFVTPHEDHMTTIINGILISEDEIKENLKKNIKKFNFNRSFAFGFKGWTYIRLIAIDLSKGEVITNKRGKEVKDFYKVS